MYVVTFFSCAGKKHDQQLSASDPGPDALYKTMVLLIRHAIAKCLLLGQENKPSPLKNIFLYKVAEEVYN